ncbi:Ig-like domain (group 3) [Methanobrevibacter gottschalkii]|uniref:Ig-like domain-containing protein n=2 Tax=Methanobrevibacter gottschalkii TaxID=190974 RepID=A0A3N5BBF0_9EURY|nr:MULTISPECIES: Ig-like domain-containing protein [Methanobrevibacter]MCQ2970819.1 Ig-like domain-containing protein [archaeon]OEC93907.1 hypothetical protein A9505_00980 [Methanobrevibacter sp. A27]RPF52760.1 Ig-like domain-containing protein [Methanobrevibacter gottschalkii DSM 11977]SEK23304.1 Ig-like domain (group 3) [Methanobrevibacter gottschalkii]
MNAKLNTTCFILLFIFLITAVSAADNKNETLLTQKETDSSQKLCKSSVSKETSKKEKVTLKAPNLKMYYKDGSKFKATVKNKNKKAITKAKVDFTVNGKVYNKKTDSKGDAYLTISSLKSGNYPIKIRFAGTTKYTAISKKSTITVKSTIKSNDFKKYYKNTSPYTSKFYNQKGNILKNKAVKFKLNKKHYTVKTDKKGVGKLPINLKPGTYAISIINPKTSETVNKKITIKSLIKTKDLSINGQNDGKFNVKVFNNKGEVYPNQKVTFKINGKTYSKKTNKNGIATLDINLDVGKHSITTEYMGLKNTNKININKIVKSTNYIHTTLIPNYVNVTAKYVVNNSVYCLKSGINGIIKMPKNEIFKIQVGGKIYTFTTTSINGINSITLRYNNNYLVPFDGSGVKSYTNRNKLTSDGIIISKVNDYTQIDYQSKTKDNTALFGFYASKGLDKSETLTYVENDKITAKINFNTLSFDEFSLRYSLSALHGKTIYNFNYGNYNDTIRFANTNTPVTFSYFGNSIVGYASQETIITKFKVDEIKEVEKEENISYGLNKKYRTAMGFEVLQSYTLINEKINQKTLENWVLKNPDYLSRFGVMNIYGMHLASLEVAWIADIIADKSSKELNVNWKRNNTLTILGGINLEDTYLNILNADMGMKVTGKFDNAFLFKLLNSMNLPNIEEYALLKVAYRYLDKSSNSLDNVFLSILKNNFSIAQLDDMIYIFSEANSKSAIILNTSSGVSSVVLAQNSVYKGSSLKTTHDCCGVGIIPKDIIKGIKETFNIINNGLSNIYPNKTHPISKLFYMAANLLAKPLNGVGSLGMNLITTMALIQSGGTTYRNEMVEKSDWHEVMDKITFTRPGYLQSKKIYNIPNEKGGCDFIEVKIRDDMTLDRNNAIYISDGKTRKLSKTETYKYFIDDYWTPFSMPQKYWDKSWNR